MKKIILILFGLFIAYPIIGQNINNHWILGNVDLDFSTNPPTANTIANGGKYGYASVSDENGDLLFYTDGNKVYNKNHQVMTGGGNIGGPAYTSDWIKQPVIILPKPGNDNQYYIFHVFQTACLCTSSNATYNPFTYAIVEFNSSNPLGTVTEQMMFVGYYGETSRSFNYLPLSMIYSPFINGFYIITSSDDFYPPQLHIYKFDENGFSHDPVKYNLNSDDYIASSKGSIKFNGLGNKVAITLNKTSGNIKAKFKLLDFNLETGELSNLYVLETSNNSSNNIESFEFSSDSQKIYYIKGGEVYVRDINNLSLPAKKLADSNNSSIFPDNFQHLQKDKYENIWIASSSTSNNRNKYLHKIENQNSYNNSSVTLNSVYLQDNIFPSNRMSLPQIIPNQVPCTENIYVTIDVGNGTSDYQKAFNNLTASNTVGHGGLAEYKAGNSILLSDGFNVEWGAEFRAYIEDCTNYAPRTRKVTNTNESLDNKQNINVRLYPNPNNGNFEVSLSSILNEEVLVEIYDVNSRLIDRFTEKMNDTNLISIKNQNLKSGIYLVKISSQSISETIKFIKK